MRIRPLTSPAMKQKLTKRTVDALKAAATRYEVFDSELAGFLVRVAPDSAKTFYVRYRVGPGASAKRRRLKIGAYGTLTAEEARGLAKERLAEVVRGADPAGSRRKDRQAPTVASLGEEFLSHVADKAKSTTIREYRRLWSAHVLPELGNRLVAGIVQSDIARIHRSLRPTSTQANRVLALLGSFFSWTERQGLRDRHSSPTQDIGPYPETLRERFLTQEETMRLGQALTTAETVGLPTAASFKAKSRGMSAARKAKITGRIRGPYKVRRDIIPAPSNPYAVAAIRFIILTGWRRSEALSLKWDYLNEDLGFATLPDSKTGRTVRVLGNPARELLSALPRLEGSPCLLYTSPSPRDRQKSRMPSSA